MKAICISASNMTASRNESVSIKLCEMVADALGKREIICEIVDLRDYSLSPCIGCGK